VIDAVERIWQGGNDGEARPLAAVRGAILHVA
jgi:hypothetical protein